MRSGKYGKYQKHKENPTSFKKGQVGYWLGKKRPTLKTTNASKGMFKKGHTPHNKGKKLWVGRLRDKLIVPSLGGDQHPMWKGGISKDRKKYNKQWRKTHKELLGQYQIQRRARKHNANGTHTLREWHELKQAYNFTCPSCLKREPEITLTRDHIQALSAGGTNDIANIQPLCRSCNSKKHIKYFHYERITV